MTEDQKRELLKVREAVQLAMAYHMKTNEANAALHSSETVLYSPLTTKLITALTSLDRLVQHG